MNLHEEHALLKVLGRLYPETKDMTVKEIIVHLNTMAFLNEKIMEERGINETFKAILCNINSNPRV